MEHCGKPIFYKNGRFWIQHENGVDCILLDLSALRGRDGGRGTTGATGPAGATISSIIPYSSGGLGAFGNVNPQYIGWLAFSSNENVGNFNSPRNGTLDNLSIYIASNDTTSPSVFTIRVSPFNGLSPAPALPFAPTTQTITVPAGTTGQFFSVGAAVPIIKGDRISLEVIPGADGGGGPQGGLFISGGIEVK